VGVGAVIYEFVDGHWVSEAFGGILLASTVEDWRRLSGKRKVIHQAELWPAAAAVKVWSDKLKGRRSLWFVDNEAARIALVKGTTHNKASASIVNDFWEVAAVMEVYAWLDRVPSIANPADGPSRGEWDWLLARGCKIISLDCLQEHVRLL
jgi:hypothetical protein